MSVPLDTLEQLRERFPGSSWTLWSDEFPDDGCIEENPDRLIEFIESNRDRLTPAVVFVSLNPSGEVPTNYQNFHSPKGKHYDDRLKDFIQGNRLETLTGGYMTDIVPDVVDSDSENVSPETADVSRFLEQLSILDESEYHVICFTGKTFETLRSHFDADPSEGPHQVESFSTSVGSATLHVHRVWFYGLYGVYQHKVAELEKQLVYLNDAIDLR